MSFRSFRRLWKHHYGKYVAHQTAHSSQYHEPWTGFLVCGAYWSHLISACLFSFNIKWYLLNWGSGWAEVMFLCWNKVFLTLQQSQHFSVLLLLLLLLLPPQHHLLDTKYKILSCFLSTRKDVIKCQPFCFSFIFSLPSPVSSHKLIISVHLFRENEVWRGRVGPGDSRVLESKETR